MKPLIGRVVVYSLTWLFLVGCNRSSPPAATPPEPVSGGKELPKVQPVSPEPKVDDAIRRSAEWVLRVGGGVKGTADGVPFDVKSNGKLPDGTIRLLTVDLRSCPKATDDGRDYLRGLTGLHEFLINHDTPMRNFDYLEGMTSLELLDLTSSYSGVSDADLAHIQGLKKLKVLSLYCHFGNEKVTDTGLNHLKGQSELEHLNLNGCHITDVGLKHLSGLTKLRKLTVSNTNVGDTGLESLKAHNHLTELNVQKSKVTAAGIKSFQAAVSGCNVIQ